MLSISLLTNKIVGGCCYPGSGAPQQRCFTLTGAQKRCKGRQKKSEAQNSLKQPTTGQEHQHARNQHHSNGRCNGSPRRTGLPEAMLALRQLVAYVNVPIVCRCCAVTLQWGAHDEWNRLCECSSECIYTLATIVTKRRNGKAVDTSRN